MKLLITLVSFLLSLTIFAETIHFNRSLQVKQEIRETITTSNFQILFNLNKVDILKSENIKGIDKLYSLKHDSLLNTSEVGKAKKIYYSQVLVGNPSDFKIKVSEGKGTYINKKLTPSKRWPCRCAQDQNINFFKVDINSYRKSNQKFYKKEYLGDLRGVPLTRISMYPIKTWGMNGFEVFSKIEFNIRSNKTIKVVDDFSKIFKLTSNKNYLIITPKKFRKSLEPLIQLRKAQGYNVSTYNLENIGDTFEQVQTFIHTLYKRDKFTYALLVGSEEAFPTEYVPTSSDSRTPSDLKYFTMSGEFDDIPDVLYGRFVVASDKDVKNQIHKITQFENRTFSNEGGRKSIIGIASNEGSGPSDVDYIRQMQRPLIDSFAMNKNEFLQDNTNSTADNINKALSKGSVWMNYIGHGSGNSWSSINIKEYSVEHVKNIKAGSVMPVIVDVACQNGRFNLENKLGERFMNQTDYQGNPIGAVAYYGGSVDISWHPPALMAVAINKKLAAGGSNTLGSILLAGQLELYNTYSDRQSTRENFIWYHLLGDPALVVDLQ